MPRTSSKTAKAAPKKSSAAKNSGKNDETMLRELFVEELKDIYWAEKHLTKALPKMKKAATSEELANAFEEHLEVTYVQIERIEEVFEMLDMPARAKKCDAMEGLVRKPSLLLKTQRKALPPGMLL